MNLRANYPAEPNFEERPRVRKSQPGAVHERNPVGTKLLKRIFKAQHGVKPVDMKELRHGSPITPEPVAPIAAPAEVATVA